MKIKFWQADGYRHYGFIDMETYADVTAVVTPGPGNQAVVHAATRIAEAIFDGELPSDIIFLGSGSFAGGVREMSFYQWRRDASPFGAFQANGININVEYIE